MKRTLKEPLLHGYAIDGLPEDHYLAQVSTYCKLCKQMVHAFNNECMEPWAETGKGNFCMPCFLKVTQGEEEGDDLDYFSLVSEGDIPDNDIDDSGDKIMCVDGISKARYQKYLFYCQKYQKPYFIYPLPLENEVTRVTIPKCPLCGKKEDFKFIEIISNSKGKRNSAEWIAWDSWNSNES